MSPDLDRLIQDFNNFFLNLYHQNKAPAPTGAPAAGADGGAFLAFEPIGTAITPDMLTLQTGQFSPVLAGEQFSTLANTLPLLDGTSIKGPSIRSVDGLYEVLLASAAPLPTFDRGAFDRFKNEAGESFDRAKAEPLLPGGREYRPAAATPPDWCAPLANAVWTTRTFSQEQATETGAGTGAPPPPPLPRSRLWNWRVLPLHLAPALESPAAVQRVMRPEILIFPAAAPPQRPAAVPPSAALRTTFQTRSISTAALAADVARPQMVMAAPMAARRELLASEVLVGAVPSEAHAAPTPPAARMEMMVRPEQLAVLARSLVAASTSTEVVSKSLLLSCDYCLVNIARPWLSTPFLSMKGWFMQGNKAGEMASGTGAAGAPFEVIPVAALVVRNLVIRADWSKEDAVSVQNAVSVGPFSLCGRTFEAVDNRLSCPGMQIIGWVCEPMPRLPPADDPGQS